MTRPAMARPRVGFLGLGWIGRHRFEALAGTGAIDVVALADTAPEAVAACAGACPGARLGSTLDDVLAARPEGVVIATPSALHAAQAVAALEAGAAVFCQKPLGRNAAETRAAVAAARRADRLLAADLSYRHTAGMVAIRQAVEGGRIGRPLALDLTFHNAYGPDKPWFHDRALSGGGCVIDLGVHLVDLALWLTGWPGLRCTSAQLFSGGARLSVGDPAVEDFAMATLETTAGGVVRIACSWNLSAGCDAVIRAEIHGDRGGAVLANVGGSFYDFEAHLLHGRERQLLAVPPDDWGGRAAVAWLEQLANGAGFDPACEGLVTLAEALDAIYGHSPGAAVSAPRGAAASLGARRKAAGPLR